MTFRLGLILAVRAAFSANVPPPIDVALFPPALCLRPTPPLPLFVSMHFVLKNFFKLCASGLTLGLVPLTMAATPVEKPDAAGMAEMAQFGAGFLVWERSVRGEWQIWTRSLAPDGKEELLVPEEAGRDHFCPKLSPDGSKLVYLSYKRGEDAYDTRVNAALWLMDLTTRKLTRLVEAAKSYAEDRAVVWFDSQRFCYVNGNGETQEWNLASGSSKRLVSQARGKYGFLVNPTQTYATSGSPEFAAFEPKTGVVENRPEYTGCQPYFSQDGKWGFWMGGSGGPINRIFLPLGTVSPILVRADHRLPEARSYMYFPMLSPCMKLLAFGASPHEHDHFKANYNLFVVRVDPDTLEVLSKPVQYTFYKGTDRYPDVYLHPLPLGSHFTEGPAQLTFHAPEPGACRWRVDGKEVGQGAELTHAFGVGDHWVQAEEGGHSWRGYVHARQAMPPAIVSVERSDARTVSITFNKAVALTHATASASGQALTWRGQAADDHVALLNLPPHYVRLADILISGVQDKAQTPNILPPTQANVTSQNWPSPEDLVFAWESKKARPLPAKVATDPEPHGQVFWSATGGMAPHGGWYELAGAGDHVMYDCRKARAITLEAILTARAQPKAGEAWPVFSVEDRRGKVKCALAQRADGYYLYLATESRNQEWAGETRVAPAPVGKAQHLVCGYENGNLTSFVNGAPVALSQHPTGRPSFEKGKGTFLVGASPQYPGAAWPGTVDHLACYSHACRPAVALGLYDLAGPALAGRSATPPTKVTARLVETSRLPTLEQIKPYKEALVKNDYEILEGTGELSRGGKIVVAHWVWMNGERAAAAPAQVGQSYSLSLEPLAAHPEIQPLVIKDDLTNGLGADEFLEVGH